MTATILPRIIEAGGGQEYIAVDRKRCLGRSEGAPFLEVGFGTGPITFPPLTLAGVGEGRPPRVDPSGGTEAPSRHKKKAHRREGPPFPG